MGTIAAAVFTVYLWPATSSWVATRVSTDDLDKVESRVKQQESVHAIDYPKLNLANDDDTGALSHGSQVEWLIIRVKRLQMREVETTKHLACAEAKLKMPNPKSDAAKGICKAVGQKYDELIGKKTPPDEAARLAIDSVFGND